MYRGLISMFAAEAAALSQTTQVDLSRQSKSVDFTSAATTKPFKAGTALPPTCSVGELFWQTNAAPGANIYGCTATNTWTVQGGGSGNGSGSGSGGGSTPGAQFESGLGDFAATRLSSTEVSIAANPGGTAVRCGDAVTIFAGTMTITANTGSLGSGATLYPYVDCTSSPAALKVDTNAAVTPANLILAGAAFGNFNANGYPPDSIPLPQVTGGTTTDQFDANPFTDYRSFLSSVVVRCGANLVRTIGTNGSYTCAVDPTSTLAWTGVADLSGAALTKSSRFVTSDPAACSEGESFYNTTSHQRKDCIGANSWQPAAGLLTFQAATQPIAIAGGAQSTTIYSYTLAPGGIQAGGCITVEMGWQSSTVGSGTITPTFNFGTTSVSLYTANNLADTMVASVDVCNLPGYQTSQQIDERSLMLSSHSATGVPDVTVSNQNTQQPVTASLSINGSGSSGFSVSGLWFKVTRN